MESHWGEKLPTLMRCMPVVLLIFLVRHMPLFCNDGGGLFYGFKEVMFT